MDRIRQLIDYCEKNPHPVALEVGEAYEHIMSQIGRNPTDSLFDSLNREKRKQFGMNTAGSSRSTTTMDIERLLQPNTYLNMQL